MSRLNTCLYGSLEDVIEMMEFESEQCEIRAAIQNLARAVLALQAQNDTTPAPQVQTSGPQCKRCGAFTTYARVNTIGLCMKCEREAKQ